MCRCVSGTVFCCCCSCALNVAIWIFMVLLIAFGVIVAGIYLGLFNIDKQSPQIAGFINNTILNNKQH